MMMTVFSRSYLKNTSFIMKVLKVEDDPTHIKIIKYSSSTLQHNDDYHIRRHITEDGSLGTVELIASMKHHPQKDHPSSSRSGLSFLFILSCRQYLAR